MFSASKNSLKTNTYTMFLLAVCVVVMTFTATVSYAQQSVVDDILPQLSNYEEENNARVDILLRLANGYLFVSPQQSQEIGLQAKELSEKIGYTKGIIRANLIVGRSFQFRGEFGSDLEFFIAAQELAHQYNDISFLAEIYRNMGEHYSFAGNHSEALEHLQMAINYAEQQEDKRLIGATYFSMGSFFMKIEKLPDAENYYLKALTIFEEINEKRGVGVLYGSLGVIAQQRGDYEQAVEYLTRNIETFLELGDYLSLAESYLVMAQLEKKLGDEDKALEHLNTARVYADTSKDLNKKTLILLEVGLIELDQKNYVDSEANLNEALLLAQSLNVMENELNVHDALSRLYKETDAAEKSLVHLEAYNKIRDQLYPVTYSEDLLRIQSQFDAERRESEINSLRRIQAENTLEMERERNRLNTAIATIFFALMVVGFLTFRYNAKAHAAKQMSLNNSQLLKISKELEHVNKVKSDFLANTSHEIRTPLNGILGMVALLSRSHLTETQKEQLHAIDLSGNKLLNLVNDLLDLTKIEAGKIEILYAPLNIEEILAPEIAVWQEMAKNDNLDFKVELAQDIPHKLTGASIRIIQVLTNLISNAVKFTEEGCVCLRVSVEKDFGQEVLLHFEVEDTGIGIVESNLEHLFERFSQIDSGFSRSFQGTGLGLAISRDLVRIMNGSIGVNSVEGNGSTFWFRLPMHINEREIPRREVEHKLKQKKQTDLNSLNVLVAEDNAINQAVIKGMLEHLGHNVVFAQNGEEVVAKVVSVSTDIVLMDIQMPVMDGEEATKEIRKLDNSVANVPIVAITANAMSGDAEKFIELGMDAYLAKPLNIDRLQTTINEMKLLIEQRRA